jgi:hypothetical protein
MGTLLNTEFIDTVEVFLLETGTKKEDFKFVNYTRFIQQQKEIYGAEKGLVRHNTMKDYIIQDFTDFSEWIIKRYKNKTEALGSQRGKPRARNAAPL